MAQPVSAIDWIKADEGCKLTAYKDTVGVWTIGYGTNLQTLRISEELAQVLLIDALQSITIALGSTIPWYRDLTPTRQAALENMAYNLGVAGLLKFKRFLVAMQIGNWTSAVHELEDSLWAKQVPNRAKRIMSAILEG